MLLLLYYIILLLYIIIILLYEVINLFNHKKSTQYFVPM